MAKAQSFGPFYIGIANQASGAPFIDKAFTKETEGRYRSGKGYLIRIPFTRHRPTKGIVFGMWRKPNAEGETRA